MTREHIILQSPGTVETRSVRMAAMLSSPDTIHCVTCDFEGLSQHLGLLLDGALPVGSVEFVREAMRLARVVEPPNLSYPPGCEAFLGRTITRRRAGSVIGRWFVKPIQTKLFTGFVFDTMQVPESLDEHDREQHATFLSMDPDAEVLVSEPINFLSEWRFYVDPRTPLAAIAWARYDQLPDEQVPAPDISVVRRCINAIGLEHPYAADFGVDSQGSTVLVEVNDFWSLGLYRGQNSISDKAYLELLCARWRAMSPIDAQ